MGQLFENPLTDITGMVGIIFFLTGMIMYRYSPKNINYLYGYRTAKSMKSQDRWEFAQKYAAQLLMKIGGLLVAAGLGLFLWSLIMGSVSPLGSHSC